MAFMLQQLPSARAAPCQCPERPVCSWQTQAPRRRRQTAVRAGNSDEERDLSAQWAQFVDSAKKGMPEVSDQSPLWSRAQQRSHRSLARRASAETHCSVSTSKSMPKHVRTLHHTLQLYLRRFACQMGSP